MSTTTYYENINLALALLPGLSGLIWPKISPLIVKSDFPLKPFSNTRTKGLFVHLRYDPILCIYVLHLRRLEFDPCWGVSAYYLRRQKNIMASV